MARETPLDLTRNIAISAHVDAGKSSLSSQLLFVSGRLHRVGLVHEGENFMDSMDQEQERGITIMAAATTCFWEKAANNHRINLIDLPGHTEFFQEVSRSMRVLDGAIALFDSVAGVEPQSEAVWHTMDTYRVPRLCAVNKMDRRGADFHRAIETMRERLGANPIPVQLPLGEEDNFVGVIDLVRMRALRWEGESSRDIVETAIPAEHAEAAHEAHHNLIDAVAEYDDELMEAYLEDEETVTPEMLIAAIRAATLSMEVQPVLCLSALREKGIQPVLDAIVDYLPSPLDRGPAAAADGKSERQPSEDEPFSALAFKLQRDPQAGVLIYFRVYSGKVTKGSTILNASNGKKERIGRILLMHSNHREDIDTAYAGDIVVAVGMKAVTTGDTLCAPDAPIELEKIHVSDPVVHVAVEPATRADQEKLSTALGYIVREDPSLHMRTDDETGQTILSGMGELHLEVVIERLKREYKIVANTGRPQVAYREAITAAVKGVEGKIKRQTGGSGQYARVILDVEPGQPGAGLVFESKVRGGSVPTEYIPAVEKGIRATMPSGVIAGFPIEDVKVSLMDGDAHDVDSSDIAFQVAGSKGFKAAVRRAKPVIMEPVMALEVTVPEDFLGTVMGDINRRRGMVEGHEPRPGGVVSAKGSVPLSEMFGYANDLRSSTQGRGSFTMEFSRYEQLPNNLSEALRAELGALAEDDD